MAQTFWSNVGVAVQSALGVGKTITAITKANPGVVTSTAHGLANGDYVVLEPVLGMFQLNGKVARVANQTANTFELEGFDTTLYETFVSGTAKAITFGVSMSTVQDVNVSGGEPQFKDASTIHGNVEVQVPTTVSPMTMQFGSFWDPSDPALAELARATDTLTQRALRISFANGRKIVGFAYAAAAGVPTGAAQDIVKTPVTLTFNGLPKVYLT